MNAMKKAAYLQPTLFGGRLPAPTTARRTTARRTQEQKRDMVPCQHGYHRWHPTLLTGEWLCLVCAQKAYCPDCVRVLPPGAHVGYCLNHTPPDLRSASL